MVGVAAGLSTMGFVPFASSFAMFAAGRAFEQIRNTVGYPHLNVKIGATHGGISVGEDGASHQCNEDFAVMRTIPGMVVMCPSDDVEAKAAVRAAAQHVGPVYMRFSRFASPVFHGEGLQVRDRQGRSAPGGQRRGHHRHRPDGQRGRWRRDAPWPPRASTPGSSTCAPSSLWTRPGARPPPRTAAGSSPWRSTPSSAVWARPSAPVAEHCPGARKRIGVNDEFGHSGPPPTCSSSSACARNTSWKSPERSANKQTKSARTERPGASSCLTSEPVRDRRLQFQRFKNSGNKASANGNRPGYPP